MRRCCRLPAARAAAPLLPLPACAPAARRWFRTQTLAVDGTACDAMPDAENSAELYPASGRALAGVLCCLHFAVRIIALTRSSFNMVLLYAVLVERRFSPAGGVSSRRRFMVWYASCCQRGGTGAFFNAGSAARAGRGWVRRRGTCNTTLHISALYNQLLSASGRRRLPRRGVYCHCPCAA